MEAERQKMHTSIGGRDQAIEDLAMRRGTCWASIVVEALEMNRRRQCLSSSSERKRRGAAGQFRHRKNEFTRALTARRQICA